MKTRFFLFIGGLLLLTVLAALYFSQPSSNTEHPTAPPVSKFREAIARHRQIVVSHQDSGDETQRRRQQMLAEWHAEMVKEKTFADIFRMNARAMQQRSPAMKELMATWGLNEEQMNRTLAIWEDGMIEYDLLSKQHEIEHPELAVGKPTTPELVKIQMAFKQEARDLRDLRNMALLPILGDPKRLQQLEDLDTKLVIQRGKENIAAGASSLDRLRQTTREKLGREPSEQDVLNLLEEALGSKERAAYTLEAAKKQSVD
jgi:hypothetical protein